MDLRCGAYEFHCKPVAARIEGWWGASRLLSMRSSGWNVMAGRRRARVVSNPDVASASALGASDAVREPRA